MQTCTHNNALLKHSTSDSKEVLIFFLDLEKFEYKNKEGTEDGTSLKHGIYIETTETMTHIAAVRHEWSTK